MREIYLSFFKNNKTLNGFIKVIFETEFTMKNFFTTVNCINSLQLDYNELYLNDDNEWIMVMRPNYDKVPGECIREIHIKTKDINRATASLNHKCKNQFKIEWSCIHQQIKYDSRVEYVKRLISTNKIFTHTSIKITNRTRKQRLKIALDRRRSFYSKKDAIITGIKRMFEIYLDTLEYFSTEDPECNIPNLLLETPNEIVLFNW